MSEHSRLNALEEQVRKLTDQVKDLAKTVGERLSDLEAKKPTASTTKKK